MIDMHTHILFDVDDGAKTIEESISLINEEIIKGVSHIILTPHFKITREKFKREKVLANFEALTEMVKERNLNIKLYLGNEIYLGANFYETIEKGNFFTLANSQYILIEFSLFDVTKNIPEICYEARTNGYFPIIAHVERYSNLYKNKGLLNEILNEGAHLQVNASAVINKESKESNKFTHFLLKNELVSFIASDVHNTHSRKFYLEEAYNTVKRLCGEDYCNKIFRNNQQKILSNEYFDTPKLESLRGNVVSEFFRNIGFKNIEKNKKENEYEKG